MTPAAPAALLHDVLSDWARAEFGSSARVENLLALSAGASRENWAFDVATDGDRIPLVLKRDPPRPAGAAEDRSLAASLGLDRLTEGRLMQAAGAHGVPAPRVHAFLPADERTSPGFVMARVEGETLGRRILREPGLAAARGRLARQCGEALARVHAIPAGDLPALTALPTAEHLALYRDRLAAFGQPHPGFEYGLRWLHERLDLAGDRHTFVHGDFRNGNIIVDPDGLAAVLDWEIGHFGNPYCDLAWICVKSWRFGVFDKPVGGFGRREDLYAGYEAAGGAPVDRNAARFWEVFGTLRWGVMCMNFAFSYIDGTRPHVEPAAIGRRAAETEYDLLQMLD